MLFVYRQGVLVQVKNGDNLNGILHAANEMAEQCTREGSSIYLPWAYRIRLAHAKKTCQLQGVFNMNYLKSYFDLCFLGFEMQGAQTLTFLYTF